MNAGRYRFKAYLNARHKVSISGTASNIHPHTWELVLHVRKVCDNFVRFTDIENIIMEYLSGYEGRCLNETVPFDKINPTMENLGDCLAAALHDILASNGWRLLSLEISENPARTYIVEIGAVDSIQCTTTQKSAFDDICAITDMEAADALPEVGLAQSVRKETGLPEVEPVDMEYVTVLKRPRRKRNRFGEVWYIFFGMLLLLAAATAFFHLINRSGRYPWGSDSWYHLFKGHMLYLSIKEGNFYPLYSDIWYNGIQPLRYWAPLPHYVLAGFEFITNGDTGLSYNLFIILAFCVGGAGWILWGAKTGRRSMGYVLAILWTLLPDNLRVLFSEGNLSRVAVTAIFPYLLLMVCMYFISRRNPAVYLIAVAFLMVLITLCHAMISAMAAVTVTLFSFIAGISEKKLTAALHIIASTACGIAAAGIWLVPALKGGLLSMDSEAVKELAEGLTYPVLETLDPLNRLSDPNVFYFGTSIAAAALFGLIFGQKKTRAAFAVTLIIFTGTTKLLLPVILKLPLSQAFWMMRFTPMAMGTFFAGLFFWKKLNRKALAVILALVVADSAVSVRLLAHNSSMPARAVDILDQAAELTENRVALIDNSRMGSFPGFYLGFGNSAKQVKQVFGSGWQGAATARNIMLLNTAAEYGWYEYLFDRCLEHGADVVVITGEMFSDSRRVVEAAGKAGYMPVNGYGDGKIGGADEEGPMIFKYPVSGSFGTIVRYRGIGIGRYASNASLMFPEIETGESSIIDDYSFDELSVYETVFLSGFSFNSRKEAEKLLRRLSENGTRVVIDLTNADAELLSSRAGLFGVLAETAVFEDKLPDMEEDGKKISFSRAIPDEYEKWNTIYLENLDKVFVDTEYGNQRLDVIGTKLNDNLVFIGVNLPYYAMLTGDPAAVGLLEKATGLTAGVMPARQAVSLTMETKANTVAVRADETGAITGVAALDSFEAVEGEYSVTHDMVRMESPELILKVRYPELEKGLAVSASGLASLIVIIVFLRRKGGRAYCSAEEKLFSD